MFMASMVVKGYMKALQFVLILPRCLAGRDL